MISFKCEKLVRDNTLKRLQDVDITVQYQMLGNKDLIDALQYKLIEEADEVRDASGRQELIEELADVLEVIDALCKTQNISMQEVLREKDAKLKERGGFETGLYIESVQMDEGNPRMDYFRASPDKYPEE